MKTAASLQKKIQELQAEHKAILARERGGVIARMTKAMAAYGIKPHELTNGAVRTNDVDIDAVHKPARKPLLNKDKRSAAKGKAAPIKYRDDAGNTWAGRGNRPRWLKAHQQAGRDIEEFKVAPKGRVPSIAKANSAKRSPSRRPT